MERRVAIIKKSGDTTWIVLMWKRGENLVPPIEKIEVDEVVFEDN